MGLEYKDLQTGDLLLKHSTGSRTNVVIKTGQALISHNIRGGTADIVHAAMYAGNQLLYEASGGGLAVQSMASKRGTVYEVFRYGKADVAEIAAVVAAGYVAEKELSQENKGNYGSYALKGALGSLFHSSTRGSGAKAAESRLWGHSPQPPSNSFYCSNYVVRAYAAAGQTFKPPIAPLDVDYRYVSPKELQARLNTSNDWKHMGTLTA